MLNALSNLYVPGRILLYEISSNTGELSLTSVTFIVSVVLATCSLSDAVILTSYIFFVSKSRGLFNTIFPLYLSTEKLLSPCIIEYFKAGYVSTSFAVTDVSTVPTSVPKNKNKIY